MLRYDLQDRAVLQLPVALLGKLQLGIVEVVDFDAAWSGVDDSAVARQGRSLLFERSSGPLAPTRLCRTGH